MSDEKQISDFLSDTIHILRFTGRYDVTDPAMAKRAILFFKRRKILKSKGLTAAFINRLYDIADSVPKSRRCIFCNDNPSYNGIICEDCEDRLLHIESVFKEVEHPKGRTVSSVFAGVLCIIMCILCGISIYYGTAYMPSDVILLCGFLLMAACAFSDCLMVFAAAGPLLLAANSFLNAIVTGFMKLSPLNILLNAFLVFGYVFMAALIISISKERAPLVRAGIARIWFVPCIIVAVDEVVVGSVGIIRLVMGIVSVFIYMLWVSSRGRV